MSDRRWPRHLRQRPLAALPVTGALALMGAAALSGCGGGSPSQSQAATQPTASATASQVSFTSA